MPPRWWHGRRVRQPGRRIFVQVAGSFAGPFAYVVNASQPRLVELTPEQLEATTGSLGCLLL